MGDEDQAEIREAATQKWENNTLIYSVSLSFTPERDAARQCFW